MSLILSGTDGLSDVDGSAATPAIRGTDANTGIFFPAADTIAFSEGGAEVMRIDSDGEVGIGTTSPNTKLQVSIGSNGSGVVNALRLQNVGTTAGDGAKIVFTAGASTDGAGIASTGVALDSADLRFYSGGNTERARIDSSGNLLVGTTTTNGRLSIDSAGTTSATYVIFGRNSAGTNEFSVRSDGAGFLNAASWAYGSDLTIKENIEYLEPSNCLSLLLNAKPAKFDYIEGQKSNYGYIAQDVQTWLPDAVIENPNGKLSLQDGFINAISISAMQGLHQLIQELKAINDTQAETINALTARIVALENKP